jgi:hypothetical protein
LAEIFSHASGHPLRLLIGFHVGPSGAKAASSFEITNKIVQGIEIRRFWFRLGLG